MFFKKMKGRNGIQTKMSDFPQFRQTLDKNAVKSANLASCPIGIFQEIGCISSYLENNKHL